MEVVVLEQGVPVLVRTDRRIVERSAAERIVHQVDQIRFVFGGGARGALKERMEAERAALRRV